MYIPIYIYIGIYVYSYIHIYRNICMLWCEYFGCLMWVVYMIDVYDVCIQHVSVHLEFCGFIWTFVVCICDCNVWLFTWLLYMMVMYDCYVYMCYISLLYMIAVYDCDTQQFKYDTMAVVLFCMIVTCDCSAVLYDCCMWLLYMIMIHSNSSTTQ